MNDKTMSPGGLPGEHFPDDFPHRVIVQARHEQSQRRSRFAAAASLVLLLGLVPLSHFLRANSTVPSEFAWQDYSAKATQLAEATAPAEVSDYLAPDSVRVNNWSASYSETSWKADSDWESE